MSTRAVVPKYAWRLRDYHLRGREPDSRFPTRERRRLNRLTHLGGQQGSSKTSLNRPKIYRINTSWLISSIERFLFPPPSTAICSVEFCFSIATPPLPEYNEGNHACPRCQQRKCGTMRRHKEQGTSSRITAVILGRKRWRASQQKQGP